MKKEKKIPCEIYSRVVGYFRPLQGWNKSKAEEFWDRAEIPKKNINKFLNKLLVFIFISSPVFLYAQESKRIPALKDYNGHYFIAGNSGDQVKVMTSFKYAILYPHDIGLYTAYTQTMFWDLYKKSSPFRNIDYNPEFFWELKSNANHWSARLCWIKGFRICPIEHKSNGRYGPESRSLNRGYGLVFYDFGKKINAGGTLKIFYYYNVASQNKDIQEYTGNFSNEFFVQLRTKGKYLEQEKISYRFGFGNNTSFINGWHELNIRTRIITSRIQMFLFAQYYYGYMESLLDYNIKEQRFRIGLQLF